MRTSAVWPSLLATAALACATPPAPSRPTVQAAERAALELEASALLDRLHAAAASADSASYFPLFTDDAVYVGTDASERWSLAEFRAYAEPYFAQGRGWAYTSTERHVIVPDTGGVAWFDERLQNEKYGEVRGSGVIRFTPDGPRIAQYVLSFPVPNELAEDLAVRVRGLRH